MDDVREELRRAREVNADLLAACEAARAFGSQGETHDGLSVSELLRAATAKARDRTPTGDGPMRIDDGGPAFPCDFETGRVVEFDEQLDQNVVRQLTEKREGMSLRDYFAGRALTGLLAAQADPDVESLPKPADAADYAYRCADAMLAARRTT